MKPAAFEYHAPETVRDVCSLLDEYGEDAKILAGGQSLIPMLTLRLARFSHLVDLGRVGELKGTEVRSSEFIVKGMTTQSDLELSPETQAVPLLAQAIPHIGHFQIRNRGTIGGSLAHGDPSAELPAVAVALDAVMEISSSAGGRHVGAADFFQHMWTTTLEADEVLTAVRFPTWTGRCAFAVEEVARRAGDFALTGVVCGVELDDDTIVRACIAMFGMSTIPVRASQAERALVGTTPSHDSLIEIGVLAATQAEPPDDVHASRRYREVVGAGVVARALARALEEARSDRPNRVHGRER